MIPRLRASPRHGGAGKFFLAPKSPRGRPVGGGDVYRYWGYGGLKPPSSSLNNTTGNDGVYFKISGKMMQIIG